MDRVDIKQFVDDLQLGIHVKKYRVVLWTTAPQGDLHRHYAALQRRRGS